MFDFLIKFFIIMKMFIHMH